MEFQKILHIILPALITVIGNIIVYLWIKKSVDNKIEQQKIAYSGIFKEKIDIYREILDNYYSLKLVISRYQYTGNMDYEMDCFSRVEKFINFYLKNQPFLSDDMLDNLKKLRSECQVVFEGFYKYHLLTREKALNDVHFKEFIAAANKMKSNKSFEELEGLIITEMKRDLKTLNVIK